MKDGVRCLDLSQRKEKIAVVDETGLCQVFHVDSGELYYTVLLYTKTVFVFSLIVFSTQEPNANSVAWNHRFEDMLVFSGNNSIAIKVLDFPARRQKMIGFVVGLSGSKVFYLNGSAMNTLELPLSAPMYQYIERNMFKEAYSIARFGESKC